MPACKCDKPGSGVFLVSTPDKSTGPGCPKGKWAMLSPRLPDRDGQNNAISDRLATISTNSTEKATP